MAAPVSTSARPMFMPTPSSDSMPPTKTTKARPSLDMVRYSGCAPNPRCRGVRLISSTKAMMSMAVAHKKAGSDQMLPPLTTIRTPRSEIGSAAARMLVSLINGEVVTPSCINLGHQLIVRAST
ncbi:MAG: hypothetical protein COZ09_13855 [Comamonadaceae bacterium CG_4_10_14_3_um_filter_60_42]|nr:MAG: hypothetical protein COZ09_13855 [Comamonadaceae bacterium CG_4_10_14_3_um_filter_60_42]